MNRALIILLALITAVILMAGCQSPTRPQRVAVSPPMPGQLVTAQAAAPKALIVPGLTNVSLAWNASPSTNVVDYRVYYGQVSGTYYAAVDAGDNLSLVIPVSVGTNYFFAATAIDAEGNESKYSNEASLFTAVSTNRLVTVRSLVAPAITGPWSANPAWGVIYLTNPPTMYYKSIVTVTNF